jgi:hypothetical protein
MTLASARRFPAFRTHYWHKTVFSSMTAVKEGFERKRCGKRVTFDGVGSFGLLALTGGNTVTYEPIPGIFDRHPRDGGHP